MYIDNQEAFLAFLDRVKSSSLLAIDTEFIREKTYYAKLCLLQLGTEDEVAIVDPFAVEDLRVMADVLVDPGITKLVHAGAQDMEILLRETGVLPHPVFDTQMAAALLGYAQQIGYAALVNSVCGISLKKMDSFTDWSRRPLSPSQLEYAADDVIYLPRVYYRLKARLEELGRLSWLDPDFAMLSDPAHYEDDPRDRFRRLKRIGQLSRRQMAAAREVAEWRELEARRRDIPRKWVLTDEQIVEACRRESRSIDDLFMVRGIREHLTTKDARAVVAAMIRGLNLPPEEWPELDQSSKSEPNVDAQLDLMNALVRLRAKQNDIAVQVLANHNDLARLARGHTDEVELLRGWRKAIVGDELVALLNGELSLSLQDDELVVTKVSR